MSLSRNHAAVPRHVHCLDGLVNLVMHMIATTLHVQCFAKYNCKIFRVVRGCRPAPPIIYHVHDHVENLCYLPDETRKKEGRPGCYTRLLTAQDVFQSIPGLECNCISDSTWCKENGELQLFALSCKEICSCEPWLWSCRVSVGCMYTRVATLLLVFSDSPTSQCNTLKPVIRLVWFSDPYSASVTEYITLPYIHYL